MVQITPQEATAYLARWEQVNRHEIAELRTTPIEQKFQQLCALSASRTGFGIDPNRNRLGAEVATRWQRIRAHYGE
jgi:hypothetical protein